MKITWNLFIFICVIESVHDPGIVLIAGTERENVLRTQSRATDGFSIVAASPHCDKRG